MKKNKLQSELHLAPMWSDQNAELPHSLLSCWMVLLPGSFQPSVSLHRAWHHDVSLCMAKQSSVLCSWLWLRSVTLFHAFTPCLQPHTCPKPFLNKGVIFFPSRSLHNLQQLVFTHLEAVSPRGMPVAWRHSPATLAGLKSCFRTALPVAWRSLTCCLFACRTRAQANCRALASGEKTLEVRRHHRIPTWEAASPYQPLLYLFEKDFW